MTDRTTERTTAEERAAWRESVGIGARISSNVMARAAERLLDDLDELRAALRQQHEALGPNMNLPHNLCSICDLIAEPAKEVSMTPATSDRFSA